MVPKRLGLIGIMFWLLSITLFICHASYRTEPDYYDHEDTLGPYETWVIQLNADKGDRMHGSFKMEHSAVSVYLLHMNDYEVNITPSLHICLYHTYGTSGYYDVVAEIDGPYALLYVNPAPYNQTIWFNEYRDHPVDPLFYYSPLIYSGILVICFSVLLLLSTSRKRVDSSEP